MLLDGSTRIKINDNFNIDLFYLLLFYFNYSLSNFQLNATVLMISNCCNISYLIKFTKYPYSRTVGIKKKTRNNLEMCLLGMGTLGSKGDTRF